MTWQIDLPSRGQHVQLPAQQMFTSENAPDSSAASYTRAGTRSLQRGSALCWPASSCGHSSWTSGGARWRARRRCWSCRQTTPGPRRSASGTPQTWASAEQLRCHRSLCHMNPLAPYACTCGAGGRNMPTCRPVAVRCQLGASWAPAVCGRLNDLQRVCRYTGKTEASQTAVQHYSVLCRGGEVPLRISAGATQRLRALAAADHTTLFVALLATLQVSGPAHSPMRSRQCQLSWHQAAEVDAPGHTQ